MGGEGQWGGGEENGVNQRAMKRIPAFPLPRKLIVFQPFRPIVLGWSTKLRFSYTRRLIIRPAALDSTINRTTRRLFLALFDFFTSSIMQEQKDLSVVLFIRIKKMLCITNIKIEYYTSFSNSKKEDVVNNRLLGTS